MAKKEKDELKVDADTHERLKKQGFQKGKSGNPKGRPAIPQEVKDALAEYSLEAVAIKRDLMRNSPNEMVRLKAADSFIDPFVSKAAQKVDVDVQVTTHMADILADAARARVALRGPVIEAKAIEVQPEQLERK
ncbi:DUF5681 domain-containing protein [Sinorhizobium chiapasense]